ncbi:restriction endonuclease subunit S [Proteus mirabilis]|uniref:restriction endonuclease subunit S n=1 Tax=Proteus mirabilis TaxID=584 RepID=UPI0023F78167|nr:restriction endonuclease subunit S [Proteus mirabilis]MDF7403637.1 restriction endonuclease subunit S [Proteus mirabilis]
MKFGWDCVPIGSIAERIDRPEPPIAGQSYRQIGVRLWGEGAYERETIDGGDTKYKFLNKVESGDIIVNKIWARNGSVSLVTPELAGCYCSGEFPLFLPNKEKINPKWFFWITKTRWFWNLCDEKSRGTSGKNRIKPEKFLDINIPLPPLSVQDEIVSKIENLSLKSGLINELRESLLIDAQAMLSSAFHKLIEDAVYKPMSKVAPLERRKVEIDVNAEYPELGVRCFGNGTFHKPILDGMDVGTKKLYQMVPGDLVFSNVFAWEGAIAVVKKEDEDRVGSHRFITCLPKSGVVTADFLCFYFLTTEGLEKIQAASPGGAGRNRTLGLKKLENIKVPVPDYDKQLWFNQLQSYVEKIKQAQSENATELEALMPSILDKAFKGELV